MMKGTLRISLVTLVLALAAVPVAAGAADRVYTLQNAYEYALGTYESVKIAQEGVVQAESVVDQAWTYLYPRLTGDAKYTRYSEIIPPSGDFIFQPLREVSAGLKLTQPIYTGGRTLAALRTAETLREVSKRDLTAAEQDLMLNVAEAYYGVLKAQKLVEVSRDSVGRMERNRKVTEREARTRNTKANASALLRANTLVSQTRVILMRSEEGLRIMRQKLSMLTDLPQDFAVAEPAPQTVPPEGYDQLKAIAIASREEYRKAVLNQTVAAENITIVKGAHYPQIYAEGALRYKGADPSTIDEGRIYYGGLRLEVPIFEGGLMKAQVSEARSKLRQAELSAALLRRSIESDVYEAYVNLETITTVLKTVRQQYEDARDNFAAVESLFAEGLASSLQLIDAQQTLLVTEREYVSVLYEEQVTILRLQRVAGLLGKPDIGAKEGSHASS